ncbi:MAG: hypothetical protein SW127_20580, partial [Actinomycetota bacterium]|nr:hypothetical protein [Actinomycetota bacterium]
MLAPDDRVNFLDLLRPPEGAVLTHAVGTTFALDLLSSLQVPLAISGGSSTDLSDHIAVLAALRTTIDKIDIFHQCGQIIVPARPIRIMSLLEPAVHAITPGHGHAFRPQVWLARYERDEEIHLRLLVLTRDLTQDTGWDVVVALDGFVARHPFAVNRPLARLIQHLATSTVVPLAADRRQRLVDLSEELRYAVWEVPSDFDELGFHSLGIPGVRPSADFSGDRLVVVSPALDARGLHRLTADITGALAIVSTQTALDGLEPGQLSDDATCFVPRAAADIPPSGDRPTAGNSISGLHANLFGVERGSQVSLFVGSTTATHAAFAGDIGFLVQLHGRA